MAGLAAPASPGNVVPTLLTVLLHWPTCSTMPGLKAKAQKYFDWTLTHQANNGMIGPASNDDWWPRMVMLKALAQYQEATGDARVIPLMSRYFNYQMATLPTRPLRDWGKFRWQDNALTAIWLYNRTGDPKLIDLVRLLHQQGHDWQAQFADFKFTQPVTVEMIKLDQGQGLADLALSTHGVNNGQALKAAPVWSLVSGNSADRQGFQQMLSALDRYHGLPNGMFSCDEHYAGRNPSQGSELCTVVETMFSLEQSLAILGDAGIGDRLELIAFNSLPGPLPMTCGRTNIIRSLTRSKSACIANPGPRTALNPISMGLEPNFGCCTANFHQGWPKFAAEPVDGDNRRRTGRNCLFPLRSEDRDSRDPGSIIRRDRVSIPRNGSHHHHSCRRGQIPAPTSDSKLGQWNIDPSEPRSGRRSSPGRLCHHPSHLEAGGSHRVAAPARAQTRSGIQRLRFARQRCVGFLLSGGRELGKVAGPGYHHGLAGLPQFTMELRSGGGGACAASGGGK